MNQMSETPVIYQKNKNISGCYHFFLTAISKEFEPNTYNEAKQYLVWNISMGEESIALESTNTWSICFLPPDKHIISWKWVYKVEYHSDGALERHNARLVVKWYTHQERLDYNDTYSLVPKLKSVQMLLETSTTLNWSLSLLDISNAFF